VIGGNVIGGSVGNVIGGSVTVVVVSGGNVRVVVLVVAVVVVVEGRVVEVGGGRVVVVVVAGCVVDVVEAGRKLASTMNQLVAEPRVRLPAWGPPTLDRMSSMSEEALPFRTSRTYGTLWLLPGSA